MRAVAHNPAFAKKVGIPQSVGKEYMKADKRKGKRFDKGGSTTDDSDLLTPEEARLQAEHGDSDYINSIKEARKKRKEEIEGLGRRFTGTYGETREAMSSLSPSQKQKALLASAAPALALVPGKALLGAGAIGMSAAAGRAFNEIRNKESKKPAKEVKKETKEKDETSYRKGGSVKSSASRRADGIAQRGKTRGRYI